MTFGAPRWLWGLLLIPLLTLLFLHAERRGLKRLREFVSARLLPQLAGTINRPRRIMKFVLQLLGLALAIVSLAQPRWGYTFQDVQRKGLDLLIAVDTSRSMLSNDVQPDRLQRVKLAAQDLINTLQGDRVGLIAFAGRAFLQAPLTIDYDAVVEAINDLDTKTIPEGGTNISSAIALAAESFGKSAMGNRALIIFTDGEELSGDAVNAAKNAAAAGVRIFTVGVGTPQGSLIPITGDDGQATFVKDEAGQVVQSKLDEKRLREIAEATNGFYLHLDNGPRTMQQLYSEGLAKMQAAEMDVRLARRPIERYQWPLSAALIALALSILIPERKRVRERVYTARPIAVTAATAPAILLLFIPSFVFGSAPGIDAYRHGNFEEAFNQFQQTLKTHPRSRAEDKLQFDSGAAAYKLKDYNKALESFSQALLAKDTTLQAKSHYNLGNTLYQRGETQNSDDKKLGDWTNALDHYEQTLKLNPQNKEAKDNYEYVKKKIEELKNKKQPQQQPQPPPQQQQQKNKQDQQQNGSGGQSQQQQQSSQSQQQKDQQQNQQAQGQSGNQQERQQQQQQSEQKQQQQGSQPSPPAGGQKQNQQRPGQSNQSSPASEPGSSPPGTTPEQNGGEQSGEGAERSATPAESLKKKFAGELKGTEKEQPQSQADKAAQIAEAEAEKEGQMSPRQAEALLRSMKDEEARVQLGEHKLRHRVYKDW
jgi:Ca-activated chloride channel family protein